MRRLTIPLFLALALSGGAAPAWSQAPTTAPPGDPVAPTPPGTEAAGTPPAPSPVTKPRPPARPAFPIVRQEGPNVIATIRTDRSQPLGAKDSACVQFRRPAAVVRQICVLSGGRTVVTHVGSQARIHRGVTVERVGRSSLSVVVDASALILRPGHRYTVRGTVRRVGGPLLTSPGRTFAWRSWTVTGCQAVGPRRITRAIGPAAGRVGLSYDDGPSGYTVPILRLLREYDAHATFFVIGDHLPSGNALLRRILSEGHLIGNHSLHHEMPARVSGIEATQTRVRQATGFTPCSFRPPGGATNSGLEAAVAGRGLRSILWSVDTRDWTRPGSGRIARTALSARAGDIILLHDGGGPRGQTVDATRTILQGLRKRNLTPVTIEELLGARLTYGYR